MPDLWSAAMSPSAAEGYPWQRRPVRGEGATHGGNNCGGLCAADERGDVQGVACSGCWGARRLRWERAVATIGKQQERTVAAGGKQRRRV
jgi:hypothetical protein